MSSNPWVTSSNPWVTSSNPWVTSSNPRVTSSNPRVTSSNPQITKSMKTQVISLKSSSFLKIINSKLFGHSWGNSYVQFLVIISFFKVSTTSWLRLQQEAEWLNNNFGRRDLTFPQKIHLSPDDFGEICFFLCF